MSTRRVDVCVADSHDVVHGGVVHHRLPEAEDDQRPDDQRNARCRNHRDESADQQNAAQKRGRPASVPPRTSPKDGDAGDAGEHPGRGQRCLPGKRGGEVFQEIRHERAQGTDQRVGEWEEGAIARE